MYKGPATAISVSKNELIRVDHPVLKPLKTKPSCRITQLVSYVRLYKQRQRMTYTTGAGVSPQACFPPPVNTSNLLAASKGQLQSKSSGGLISAWTV